MGKAKTKKAKASKKEVNKPEVSGLIGAGSDGKGGEGKDANAKPDNFKVTKISVSPSRKVNLGNYSNVELSAFVEVEFDKPVDAKSGDVEKAFEVIRGIAKKELSTQFEPYRKALSGGKKKAKKAEK